MSRRIYSPNTPIINQIISAKIFFFLSGVSFLISVIWILSVENEERVVLEAIENVGKDVKYMNIYRKPHKLPKDFKYILLWTPRVYSPFYFFGVGQQAFLRNNCPVANCYMTSNRYLFGGNITRFDAVAFNGRNMVKLARSWLPRERSSRQKYIFFNLESADNYPVCSEKYEGYFNWTSTYKLDSDIPYPYVLIKDQNGAVVGPKANMKWIEDDSKLDHEYLSRIQNKTKAVAWFVSNCADRSGRRDFVWFLSSALSNYKLTIDVYGKCGNLKCSYDNKTECDKMVERDYYFYLAMENSFAEDYITEKVLTAMQHYVVPIVYGSANYSRFLPPSSYIDARVQSIPTLAATIASLIKSPMLYSKYFRWKQHYTYHDPTASDNVCAICAALHNKTMMETPSVYQNFRSWWNPKYRERCWWVDGDDEMDGL